MIDRDAFKDEISGKITDELDRQKALKQQERTELRRLANARAYRRSELEILTLVLGSAFALATLYFGVRAVREYGTLRALVAYENVLGFSIRPRFYLFLWTLLFLNWARTQRLDAWRRREIDLKLPAFSAGLRFQRALHRYLAALLGLAVFSGFLGIETIVTVLAGPAACLLLHCLGAGAVYYFYTRLYTGGENE